MNIAELRQLPQERLVDIVREQDLANGKPVDQMRSDELLNLVLRAHAEEQDYLLAGGVVDMMSDGYAFLRQTSHRPGQTDVYVLPLTRAPLRAAYRGLRDGPGAPSP